MATIEVNQQKIKFNENDYLNLKSLLPKLQKEFPIDQFQIAYFKVNGRNIDLSGESPELIRPISRADHIEIAFDKNKDVVNEIMSDVNDLIDRLLGKIAQCSNELKNDEVLIAQVGLGQVIDGVNTFIKAIHHIISTKFSAEESDLPIKELQIHLLSIMKAISNAHKVQDLIMLTDLLEYELKDNLTQWKILVIPNLRKIL